MRKWKRGKRSSGLAIAIDQRNQKERNVDAMFWKQVFFLAVIGVVFLLLMTRRNKANALPTFDEYTELHPMGNAGLRCHKCNSTHIRNLGVNGMHDDSRIVRCGTCDTALYTTER